MKLKYSCVYIVESNVFQQLDAFYTPAPTTPSHLCQDIAGTLTIALFLKQVNNVIKRACL